MRMLIPPFHYSIPPVHYGCMEKQETETDTESGNGHGNQKRPLPDQYFVQISGFMTAGMCAVVCDKLV